MIGRSNEQTVIGRLRRPTGMFLAWFWDSKLSWSNFNSRKFSSSIYIYKVVISGCLFVCPIINQETPDSFDSNFDWGTRESNGKVLSLVLPGHCWAHKLIYFKKLIPFSCAILLLTMEGAGLFGSVLSSEWTKNSLNKINE